MAQQQIKGATGDLGSGGQLDVYDVPGSAVITPFSVSATFDGSGAGGPFLPCLTFKTQTGAIIARCPAPEVASGDTADVSWFPHVAGETSVAPGGIDFNEDNEGGYLSIVTKNTIPNSPFSGFFLADASGGGIEIVSENVGSGGGIVLQTQKSGTQIDLQIPSTGTIQLGTGSSHLDVSSASGTVSIVFPSGSKLGFYGASAISKPAATGSRAGNAALASLLTQLAALGLITDSTTA